MFHTHDCGKSISDTIPVCPGCGDWNHHNSVGAQKRAAGVSIAKSAPIAKAITTEDPAWQAEQVAWLDEHAQKFGLESARKLAEVNKNTTWGEAWLTKHKMMEAEEVAKAAEVALQKATTDMYEFAKRRCAELGLADGRDEGRMLGVLLNRGDEEAQRFAGLYEKARLAKMAAHTTAPAEAITAQIEKLEGEEAADVEKFAIAHNLDLPLAKQRVLTLSKSAAARADQIAELYNERMNVRAMAEHAQFARHQLATIKRAEEQESLENQSQLAMQKARGPAGRRLVEHVTEMARKSAKPFEVAMRDAILTDPVATALYETSREER